MANNKQAAKRHRQSESNRLNNKWQITRMRSAIRLVRAEIALNNYEKSMASYRIATSYIDRLQSKGHVHKNTAARLKSRLNAAIKAILPAAA